MKSLSLLTFVFSMALGTIILASCDELLPADEICRDIGYAIANKSFECNGDVDASNKKYEDFMAKHTCKIKDFPSEGQLLDDRISTPPRDSVGDPYKCSASILQFSCDKVSQIGDDSDQWLSASPYCLAVYDPVGTGNGNAGTGGAGGNTEVGGAGGDTGGVGGEAGAAGTTNNEPVLDLYLDGTIQPDGVDQDVKIVHLPCTITSDPYIAFLCKDSNGNGLLFTIKKLATGYTEKELFDENYAANPYWNDVASVTPMGLPRSCTTTIVDGPNEKNRVNIALDARITGTSPTPFSFTLKGNATNVFCGNSCL